MLTKLDYDELKQLKELKDFVMLTLQCCSPLCRPNSEMQLTVPHCLSSSFIATTVIVRIKSHTEIGQRLRS